MELEGESDVFGCHPLRNHSFRYENVKLETICNCISSKKWLSL